MSHEFSFTAGDFGRTRDLIYRRVGISPPDRKSEMVYNRLARRLHVIDFDLFRDHLDTLEKGHLPDEQETLTNALTTSFTAFFHEQHHFPILHKYAKARRTSFTVWCSASSMGKEPYSTAITLAEAPDSMPPSQVSVIASDVDTSTLARVRTGIHPTERVAVLPPERLRKYFLRSTGKQKGYARVRSELQAMTDFRQINLLERDQPLQQKFDVTFCRNVMAYLNKSTQVKVFEHFIDVMKPGGLLLTGHSESFLQVIKAQLLRDKTVYEATPELRARIRVR